MYPTYRFDLYWSLQLIGFGEIGISRPVSSNYDHNKDKLFRQRCTTNNNARLPHFTPYKTLASLRKGNIGEQRFG